MKRTFPSLFLLFCFAVALTLGNPAQVLAVKKVVKAAATVKAVKAVKQVDINSATLKELCSVSGIGKVTARRIMLYRTENDGFKDLAELNKIEGISGKTFEKIKAGLIIVKGGKVLKMTKEELEKTKKTLAAKKGKGERKKKATDKAKAVKGAVKEEIKKTK